MLKAKFITFEAIQFIPILTLASSFIVAGKVDLERASVLFVISAALAALVTAVVLLAKVKANPVLLGTNAWLLIGAIAFGIPIEPLADLVNQARGAGLFTCVLGVGIVLTIVSKQGFSGVESKNRSAVRKGSIVMLILTAIALAWSIFMVENIRLGGGLPFILLNVCRRILSKRLSDS